MNPIQSPALLKTLTGNFSLLDADYIGIEWIQNFLDTIFKCSYPVYVPCYNLHVYLSERSEDSRQAEPKCVKLVSTLFLSIS